MRYRSAVIFLVIVFLPLGFLVWLVERAGLDAEAVGRQKFKEVLLAKLKDLDQGIAGVLLDRERELLTLTRFPAYEPGLLRQTVLKNPSVDQVFVLGADGEFLYPSPRSALNDGEREFLEHARRRLAQPDFLRQTREAASGWYVWYTDLGLNLIFWRRAASGEIIGAELARERLLSDILARLPNPDPRDPAAANSGIALLDSAGAVLHFWGGYQPPAGEAPRTGLSLSPPLNSWRLDCYVPVSRLEEAVQSGRNLHQVLALLALIFALTGLAIYFYREYTQEVREATQRVNFVNQVSHELKTPLTNIRLYAELLQNQLPEEDSAGDRGARVQQYLNVIVTESQRLSRLISNVLTFARQQRQALRLEFKPGVVDETIGAALEQFRPALDSRHVAIRFAANAPARVRFDADAVGQILGNLFSNVEKYAHAGGWLEVTSAQHAGQTTVTVADRGPGIPADQAERIFQPFYRISNKLTDGVAGTGIGLTIARELARLHGGDLILERPAAGACFRLTLATAADVEVMREGSA